MYDTNHGNVPVGARAHRRRAPSAARRLDDLQVERAVYEAIVAAEAKAWSEILAMDEAALDAALGEEEVAVVNQQTGHVGAAANANAPGLYLVERPAREFAYSEHFRLRLAGIRDGLVASRRGVEREVRNIRRMLMSSQRSVLTDAFVNLADYVHDGRLLVAERIEHGVATIEGCIAFQYVTLPHVSDGPAKPAVRRSIIRVRMLGVRGEEDPHGLAARLWLEAHLIGTVRLIRDRGPNCYGMLGAAVDDGGFMSAWAERIGPRVRLVSSESRAAAMDRTLLAVQDYLVPHRDARGRRQPYRLMVANRRQLLEAARLHRLCSQPFEERQGRADVRFDYEIHDDLADDVALVAGVLCDAEPKALRLFGLEGPHDATIWGPPPSPDMSIPVGCLPGDGHNAERAAS